PQNPMAGTPVRRDCQWTAFNFFNETPDARYSDPSYVDEKLKDDYLPVTADPRFGDLLIFLKPDGTRIHAAVYLADNIVFTKNGESPVTPWMFSTIADLIDRYSFQVAPNEHLTVEYYRNKSH